jgi:beta-phosphoglucomutase-like phosphatase (HAD superfamily)
LTCGKNHESRVALKARVRLLIGMGADKLLPAIGIEKDSRAGNAVNRRVDEIFKAKYMATLKPFHGTRDLLLHTKHLGLSLSVATSSKADVLHDLLHLATIDTKSDSSDANASKPDPTSFKVLPMARTFRAKIS